MRAFCDRLAQDGFVALAPDLYHGKTARTVEEAQQLRSNVNWKQAAAEIAAAVEALRRQPSVIGTGIGVVGFSIGANWALWLAEESPELIQAVALFYGTRGGSYAQSGAAYQGHFAETDPYVAQSGVKKLEKSLRAAGCSVSFFTYPGTGHWFFEADRQDAYNSQAAQQAWERTAAFLHERLDRA